MADQAFAARATAAQPDHFSVGGGLVDEYQPGRIKHGLLSFPAPARPGDVPAPVLRRAQAFLRNDDRRRWLEDEAEGLGAPTQVVDDPCTITGPVGGCARVDVVHSVTDGVVEENRDLARSRGDRLDLADARGEARRRLSF
jgi:hypothetical protein